MAITTPAHTPIKTRAMHGGVQELYRSPNGYGASLLRGTSFAYGGLELAVIQYTGEGADDFRLVYDTPITSDVLGNLSDDEIPGLLDAIAALPAAS